MERQWLDYEEHFARQKRICEQGLPCTLRLHLSGDLWMLQVIPGEGFPHLVPEETLSNFEEYHISLCTSWTADSTALDRLRQRWDGWRGQLPIAGWGGEVAVTSTGAFAVVGGALAEDPDVQLLHGTCAWYDERQLHISM
jgi:hypothetical protein